MLKLSSVLLVCACASVALAKPAELKQEVSKAKEWWQTAVFYQIYPRSFMDSDGDGLGDLPGITSKLEHVKNIGVTATWLSPIFDSPMRDAGYDIADFYNVYPKFGTMEDFENLLEKAKSLGLGIVLDFVPNHSSNDSKWFQQSIDRVDPYTDYYVWKDAKIVNGERQPPNNWISNFHGSAWEWNDKRKQYYLHQFGVFQPDLNYRNPKVVAEMKNVLRFWLKKGIMGFRIDAVPFLFEDTDFLDEPRSNNPSCLPTDECYLQHIHTQNLPETFDMMVQWRDVMKQFANETDGIPRVIMTEAYAPVEDTFKYMGNETHDGASFTFNFFLLNDLKKESTASDLKRMVSTWWDNVPEGRTSNWVLGNHDNHRIASKVGAERTDGLIMMTMTLPGVGVSYNGEEIDMEDGYVSWEDTQDPSAINAGKDRYMLFSRDPERTPFQWDSTKNAGFSTADKTWLPVSDKYKDVNVAKQVHDPKSHYAMYRRVVSLRDTKTLQEGDLAYDAVNENVFVLKRSLSGYETIVTILNLGANTETVSLPKSWGVSGALHVRVASVGASLSIGSEVQPSKVTLKPHEAYILGN